MTSGKDQNPPVDSGPTRRSLDVVGPIALDFLIRVVENEVRRKGNRDFGVVQLAA